VEALRLSTLERLEPALALYLIRLADPVPDSAGADHPRVVLRCRAGPGRMAGCLRRGSLSAPAGHSAPAAGHTRLDHPPGRPSGPQAWWTTRPPSPLDRLAARSRPRLGNAIGLWSPRSFNRLEICAIDRSSIRV